MLMSMIDQLKSKNITSLYTNLTSEQASSQFGVESTQNHVSSLMDSWIAFKQLKAMEKEIGDYIFLRAEGWLIPTR